VDRARGGDRHAFAELIRASGARLDATARLILRDPELAQDAVQETLIRAWRSLPGLRDPETFDHWLHSLVAHACIDLARKRRRRVVEVELTPIHFTEALDHAGEVADRDLLDRALARLEPEARAVVVLHFYLDLPLPRVARMLGIPDGTAKSRLHRSLGVLRSSMAIDDVTAPSACGRAHLMTMDRSTRVDRALPGLFDQLAEARTPDYLEAAIERASSRPQRPAWTFAGRWLPVELTSARVPTTRMPMRQLGVLALIAILVAAALAVYVGSHQQKLPAPFGPAANGLIPFEQGGDIYVGDLATGQTRLIAGGPEHDWGASFSYDGTQLGFIRDVPPGVGGVPDADIYVVRPDGSGLRKVNAKPIRDLKYANYTPDGRMAIIQPGGRAPGAARSRSCSVNQMEIVPTFGNEPTQRFRWRKGSSRSRGARPTAARSSTSASRTESTACSSWGPTGPIRTRSARSKRGRIPASISGTSSIPAMGTGSSSRNGPTTRATGSRLLPVVRDERRRR
jgi:RNA polymerase sigma-70 factor (ECF subfamily)